jgi:hypothetical protein
MNLLKRSCLVSLLLILQIVFVISDNDDYQENIELANFSNSYELSADETTTMGNIQDNFKPFSIISAPSIFPKCKEGQIYYRKKCRNLVK